MALIFDPLATPKGWIVRDKKTEETIGSIEWHHRLGVFGFGPTPGRSFLLAEPALQEIGRFIDRENAG